MAVKYRRYIQILWTTCMKSCLGDCRRHSTGLSGSPNKGMHSKVVRPIQWSGDSLTCSSRKGRSSKHLAYNHTIIRSYIGNHHRHTYKPVYWPSLLASGDLEEKLLCDQLGPCTKYFLTFQGCVPGYDFNSGQTPVSVFLMLIYLDIAMMLFLGLWFNLLIEKCRILSFPGHVDMRFRGKERTVTQSSKVLPDAP